MRYPDFRLSFLILNIKVITSTYDPPQLNNFIIIPRSNISSFVFSCKRKAFTVMTPL